MIVASPVQGGTVEAPPMAAGSKGLVTCTMRGGRPAPGVSMEVQGLQESSISNDSQIQTPDDKGVYETIEVHWFKSRILHKTRNVNVLLCFI